jgi:hypothetical protein
MGDVAAALIKLPIGSTLLCDRSLFKDKYSKKQNTRGQ